MYNLKQSILQTLNLILITFWLLLILAIPRPSLAANFLQTSAMPMTSVLQQPQLCVWDMMANVGEISHAMQNYTMMAKSQGVQFKTKVYTQEKIAMDDFRLGICDAVVATGISMRSYNPFTGSIEAIFAVPDSAHMHTLVDVLSSPALAPRMRTQYKGQPYEIAGIMPYASIYGFTRDKNITSISKLQNKRVGIFDFDLAEIRIVELFGAKPYPADPTNFAQKFNHGEVDFALAPLIAYKGLELYKGIGSKGGIVNIEGGQVSLQVLLHAEKFTPAFAQTSRNFFARSFDQYQAIQDKYKVDVNPAHWVAVSNEDRQQSEEAGRKARHVMVQQGIYNASMMRLLKKIRCNKHPTRAECTLSDE